MRSSFALSILVLCFSCRRGGEPSDASLDGGRPDARLMDANDDDDAASSDADSVDTGASDSSGTDAEPLDAELMDAELIDAELMDATMADAVPMDAARTSSTTTATCAVPNPITACDSSQSLRCANGDRAGLCRGGTCEGCVDQVDDLACAQAYGGGVGYLCLNGSCVPGDCRSDADCDGPAPSFEGRLCGLRRPRFCERCFYDSHCHQSSQYGPDFYCNTSTGHSCEMNTCAGPAAHCFYNSYDYCCPTASGNRCVVGACCTDLDCSDGRTCIEGNCIDTGFCPPAGSTYYVEPTGALGSDFIGNGSQACPFQSITRALSFSPRPDEVVVLATGPAYGGPEQLPIVVPENVRIVGDPAGGAVIEPGGTAFILSRPNSGISNLRIESPVATGGAGIQITTGSDMTTTIDHVVIVGMTEDGIVVRDEGVVTIGPGVMSSSNGSPAVEQWRRSGLLVDDQATAILQGSLSTDPDEQIRFESNSAHGIVVRDRGRLVTSGMVFLENNALAGLRVEQTPGAILPENVIDGVVARGNGQTGLPWSGIDIRAGSYATVRRVETLTNHGSGIRVSTYLVTSSTAVFDVSGIDLGADAATDPGASTVQVGRIIDRNEGAGVCLSLLPCTGATLSARGLIFAATKDCRLTAPAALIRRDECTGAVDVGETFGSTVATANCP
jgi:hypothetical protein